MEFTIAACGRRGWTRTPGPAQARLAGRVGWGAFGLWSTNSRPVQAASPRARRRFTSPEHLRVVGTGTRTHPGPLAGSGTGPRARRPAADSSGPAPWPHVAPPTHTPPPPPPLSQCRGPLRPGTTKRVLRSPRPPRRAHGGSRRAARRRTINLKLLRLVHLLIPAYASPY